MFLSRVPMNLHDLPRNFGNCLKRVLSVSLLTGQVNKMSTEGLSMLKVSGDRHIAYRLYEGDRSNPTVVFVPGYMSTMEGLKANALEKFCQAERRRYIRFDFEGLGKSSGSISDVTFGHWFEDLQCLVDTLIPEKVLLIGSSMGGWLSLKTAINRPEKIFGIILIAPAINFFKPYYDNFYKSSSEEQKSTLDSGKTLVLKKNYGEIFLRRSFIEESLQHHLNLTQPIPVNAPVRILHGVLDPDVPFKQSLQIMTALTSQDVDVTFRKAGHHQMSEEADLTLLQDTLRAFLLFNSHL